MFGAVMTALVLTVAGAPAADDPAPVAAQTAPATRSAYVQGTLNVAAGERVVLRQKSDGQFELVEAKVVGVEAALPPVSGAQGDLASLMKAEPGTIAFTLGLRRDLGSFLKIENGLDKGLGYVGYVVRISGGRATAPARTSVCSVMPGKLGYEHWQEPVIQVVVGSLTTVDDAPTCESHDVNQ